MKLTLSDFTITTERRYQLDKPIVMEVERGASFRVTQFITITRTYEYGEVEQHFQVRAQVLKSDGTPDKREPARDYSLFPPVGEFADLLPDPRARFIEALNDAVDEKEDNRA